MGTNNISLTDYSKCDSGTVAILKKVEDEIEKGRANILWLGQRKIDEPVRIVEKYNGEWRTQNYVGVLWHSGETILIRSRFDGGNGFFTTHILSGALDIQGLYLPDMHPELAGENMSMLLLACCLVSQIKLAQRQGLYRSYTRYERNDSHPRGQIDVSRHIRLNPSANGKVAYSGRERSLDNSINRIILKAYSLLEERHKPLITALVNNSRSVKNCIEQLRGSVREVSRQELSALLRQRERRINSPLYKEWEKVYQTARMILRHMAQDLAHGSDHGTDGILFDMNEMWELYLERLLREQIPEGLHLEAQFEYPVLDGKRIFRPDFCWNLTEGGKTVFLADAKYRDAWSSIAKYDAAKWDKKTRRDTRQDVFQILAYMYTRGCAHSAVICPVRADTAGVSHRKYLVNKDVTGSASLHVFGLNIPKTCTAMDEFEREIRVSEEKLKEELKEILREIRASEERLKEELKKFLREIGD